MKYSRFVLVLFNKLEGLIVVVPILLSASPLFFNDPNRGRNQFQTDSQTGISWQEVWCVHLVSVLAWGEPDDKVCAEFQIQGWRQWKSQFEIEQNFSVVSIGNHRQEHRPLIKFGLELLGKSNSGSWSRDWLKRRFEKNCEHQLWIQDDFLGGCGVKFWLELKGKLNSRVKSVKLLRNSFLT